MYTPTNNSVSGTHLVGTINITYSKLVELFGEPNIESDGYKTSAEWQITNGTDIICIYDYKTSKNYSEDGLDTQDIVDWHVGGLNQNQFIELTNFLGEQQ